MDVVASLSQGHTAAVQSGLFTHKLVPVIFEPPCIYYDNTTDSAASVCDERQSIWRERERETLQNLFSMTSVSRRWFYIDDVR